MTWIPVGERLPEVRVDVLCWMPRGIIKPAAIVLAIDDSEHGPYWFGDTCGHRLEHIRLDLVTHWQPLPEPPEKEGA